MENTKKGIVNIRQLSRYGATEAAANQLPAPAVFAKGPSPNGAGTANANSRSENESCNFSRYLNELTSDALGLGPNSHEALAAPRSAVHRPLGRDGAIDCNGDGASKRVINVN
jgi:hypothetical protein